MNRETYQCDQKMINALLYDIWITSTCTNVWFEIFKKTGDDKSQTNNVDFAFLATRGKILNMLTVWLYAIDLTIRKLRWSGSIL